MELRQLKTFQTVARLLNFNRAAEVLNYAQSTVSAQIKLLEEELGVPLFDRLGRKVILTEAGQRLVNYSRKMLDIEAETKAEISGDEETRGSLSIRMPQSLGTYRLPEILGRFKEHYPEVGFDIGSCVALSLTQELKAGVVDVAFLLAESVNSPEVAVELLGVEPLIITARPDHPLAAKTAVRIRDLEGETILLPKYDCSYKMLFERLLTEEKVKHATLFELNSIEASKLCAIQGIGVTMIPEIAVQRELAEGSLVELPWVEGKLETAVLMIRHKDKWISPTLAAFMETVREVMTSPIS